MKNAFSLLCKNSREKRNAYKIAEEEVQEELSITPHFNLLQND